MEGSKVRKPPVRTRLINAVLKGERQRERGVEARVLAEQESGNPIWSMATSQTMLWEPSKCEGPIQGGLSPQFHRVATVSPAQSPQCSVILCPQPETGTPFVTEASACHKEASRGLWALTRALPSAQLHFRLLCSCGFSLH